MTAANLPKPLHSNNSNNLAGTMAIDIIVYRLIASAHNE